MTSTSKEDLVNITNYTVTVGPNLKGAIEFLGIEDKIQSLLRVTDESLLDKDSKINSTLRNIALKLKEQHFTDPIPLSNPKGNVGSYVVVFSFFN